MRNGVGAVLFVLLDTLLPAFVADQPVEAVGLHAQQVGHIDGLTDGAEIHAIRRLVQFDVMLVGTCDDFGGVRRSLFSSQWTFLIARFVVCSPETRADGHYMLLAGASSLSACPQYDTLYAKSIG